MTGLLKTKLDRLSEDIRNLGSVLVAFSGGVDSSLLLKIASDALPPGKARAFTVESCLAPPGELDAAREIARFIGVEHIVVPLEPLTMDEIRGNRRDRCYHCKSMMIKELLTAARQHHLAHVLEGSHADDGGEYRPGARALKEAGILSPLKDAGLTKAEVREAARRLGLANWNRPGSACLATRFPYDTELSPETLAQVGKAERILAEYGFEGARARHHGRILRIEMPEELVASLAGFGKRPELAARLKKLGFSFITIDMEPYVSGRFDMTENPEDHDGNKR